MALFLLLGCYLISLRLLIAALACISSPALWSHFAYIVALIVVFAVFLETLLLAGLALPLS